MKNLVIALILCAAALGQTHPDPTMKTDDPSGITKSEGIVFSFSPPEHYVSIVPSGASLLLIEDKDHNLMVRVDVDGKVEYGKNYKAEDGAKAFWSELAKAYFGVCEARHKEESKPATTKP